MVTEKWRKNRVNIFPHIKDWSADVEKYRPKKSVKEMTFDEWLYLDTSAFSLIFYGTPLISVVVCGGCAIFAYHINFWFGVFLGGFALMGVYNFINKIKERKIHEGMTFYDMYMKEGK